jgi:hypothetical protein
MSKDFFIVIGMSIAYAASFMGLLIAWWSYNKRNKDGKDDE